MVTLIFVDAVVPFFTCLLIQIGGRGTESASCLFKNIKIVPYTNNRRSSSLLKITITRSKTQNMQHLKIYPQAKVQHWYKDFYFLFAMNIMTRCHEETGTKIDENTVILFPSSIHMKKMKKTRTIVVLYPNYIKRFSRKLLMCIAMVLILVMKWMEN